jgi:RNA polymerase sigma-70 factor (ECF subfamily)
MWQTLFALAYRYLRERGLPHADAEDLAQETILATYRNLDGIEPGSLHAWVRTVARNKHLDLVRRQARIVTLASVPESLDSDDDPLAAALAAADREATVRLLSNLSPTDRRLIELKYMEDYSVDEVAVILGRPANTVKVGLFRARKRLKAHIERGRP